LPFVNAIRKDCKGRSKKEIYMEEREIDTRRLRFLAGIVTKGPRLRTRAFIPFAILLLWLATRTPLNYWGLVLAALGELLRLWAAGHIHKGAAEITTSGPYAFCRNPLYLGSGLLAVGLALVVRSYWLTAIVIVLFIAFHLVTIAYEESRLTIRYGTPYLEYCRHVPRLRPRLGPWRNANQSKFSLELLKLNKELWRALGFALFAAALVAASLTATTQ